MPITYKKLWKLLIDKEMNKGQLRELSGVSPNVIAKLGKDVAMESLIKIAEALEVDFGDIVSIEGKEND
ncbi:helix-turn-helix transcriptional regulator [Fructobacillus tropaeoli]|uniref:helix-turn-helix domain-containing protein n=1 Tax=Fructobacillus tropaeoli TaxID=709323 RepID=UPI002D900B26|nr:DNA-binding transcriptional regulator [Fructobacillus tropaeoli]